MNTTTMTRKEWIEESKKKLDEWDATLTDLESRVTDMKSGAREDLTARITAMREAIGKAHRRWDETRSTASNLWDTVTDEMSSAWEVNRMAIERSLAEVRDAIEK